MAVTDGKPNNITMAYHWARMIELLHSIEKIQALLHDPDLQGTDLVAKGERREEGIGLIEAPRGTLFHHYRVDENDQVVHGQPDRLDHQQQRADEPGGGQGGQGPPAGRGDHRGAARTTSRWRSAPTTRACPAPRTRSGQMPLEVTLVDHQGQTLDRKLRG